MQQWISDHFMWIVVVLAIIHISFFVKLLRLRGHNIKWLLVYLEELVRDLPGRTDKRPSRSLDDQINAFLVDIENVIRISDKSSELRELRNRVMHKEEEKPYLNSAGFECYWSLSRAFTEMYPLIGICGTVLAIACGLQSPGDDTNTVNAVVSNFGGSIWITLYGLSCAVVAMFFNAAFEPSFQKLLEHQANVKRIINEVKCHLGDKPALKTEQNGHDK